MYYLTLLNNKTMLVEYIIELISTWEKEGINEDQIVKRLLSRWDFDEKDIRGIINYNK